MTQPLFCVGGGGHGGHGGGNIELCTFVIVFTFIFDEKVDYPIDDAGVRHCLVSVWNVQRCDWKQTPRAESIRNGQIVHRRRLIICFQLHINTALRLFAQWAGMVTV